MHSEYRSGCHGGKESRKNKKEKNRSLEYRIDDNSGVDLISTYMGTWRDVVLKSPDPNTTTLMTFHFDVDIRISYSFSFFEFQNPDIYGAR
jgi:hypothetical protein